MNRDRFFLIPSATLSVVASLLLTGCAGQTEASEVLGSPTSPASASTAPSASSDAYEPAMPEHPARNVPRPAMPERAKENSEAGARAFLEYWAECVNYLVQTGDPEPLRKTQTKDNQSYDKVMNLYKEDYKKRNWTTGNRLSINIPNTPLKASGKYKTMQFRIQRDSGTLWGPDGKIDSIPPGDDVDIDLTAYLVHANSGWELHGYGVSNK